jgi:hypothetical protein
MKTDRRKIRDIEKSLQLNDDRFLTTIKNPSKMELEAWAQVLVTSSDKKPVKILGAVPMFDVPPNVQVTEEQGKHCEWLMEYREPNPIDTLLSALKHENT